MVKLNENVADTLCFCLRFVGRLKIFWKEWARPSMMFCVCWQLIKWSMFSVALWQRGYREMETIPSCLRFSNVDSVWLSNLVRTFCSDVNRASRKFDLEEGSVYIVNGYCDIGIWCCCPIFCYVVRCTRYGHAIGVKECFIWYAGYPFIMEGPSYRNCMLVSCNM